MKYRADAGWSPYLAGALSGLVLVLSVLIAGKYFGASTSFVRSAGMIEELFNLKGKTGHWMCTEWSCFLGTNSMKKFNL